MTKHAHKMEPRYTLKTTALCPDGKRVDVFLVKVWDDGRQTEWIRGIETATMFAKDRLVQLQTDHPHIKGRIVRHGEVPCLPLVKV